MRGYLRSTRVRPRKGRRGTALAVAMMVIVMLTAIGAVAVNAASHDLATAGAVRQGSDAEAIAEGGLILARCELCNSIDGVVAAMSSVRETRGKAPYFDFVQAELEANNDGALPTFEPPSDSRGSFGRLSTVATTPATISVRVDRPRESEPIAGYSLREAAGADTSSFCFRNYRVTSTGTYTPPEGAAFSAQAQQRAHIVAGPIECTQ